MRRTVSHFFCWLSIVVISRISSGQDSPQKTIAVIDLDTRGAVSHAEIGTLADRLRSMLVQTKAFTVVERGKMEAILKEQGFQQTGCTSTECAVEVGRILNVQEIVAGAVGKVGSKYTIDVSTIDVETGRILRSITKEHDGDIEGLLDLMEAIANQLAGKGEYGTEVGGLTVITSPVPATVFVDDRKIGVSPIKSKNLPIGEHAIKLTAEGYAPIARYITIEKGKVLKFSAKLKKKSDKTWLWIGGGAAVAGVTTLAIILMDGNPVKPDLPEADELPWPPVQ
jgi:TolB-like protein